VVSENIEISVLSLEGIPSHQQNLPIPVPALGELLEDSLRDYNR
jgi:hypothetical protein